jgi:23S rRNA (adenine2030-N6)-methyltransferase
MLSYRHSFHAGNFADVLKHLILTNTLAYLIIKDAPVFFMDTHAGSGYYSLGSQWAKQTGEAKEGIQGIDWDALFLQCTQAGRISLQVYKDSVATAVAKGQYPGSPWLAAKALRRHDHLTCTELHPADFTLLQSYFSRDRRVRCLQADGYQTVLSLIPPIQKRALILVDPSYELESDWSSCAKLLPELQYRMRSITVLLWYPVVKRQRIEKLCGQLLRAGIRNLWQCELGIEPDSPEYGMTASGMLMLNPPWTLPSQLEGALPAIQQMLAGERGHWFIKQLSAE